jgi:hypothetical protein
MVVNLPFINDLVERLACPVTLILSEERLLVCYQKLVWTQ